MVNITKKALPVFKECYNPEFNKNKQLFNNNYDNFILYGGRSGAKTTEIIYMLVIQAVITKTRVLVAREILKSIADSSHKAIKENIESQGLSEYFTCTDRTIRCKHNGSEFIFYGLRTNVTSIKSITGIDILFVEEGEGVPKSSWEDLLPSIRPLDKKRDAPITIVVFNPYSRYDDTYTRWVVNTPPKTLLIKSSYRDNPYHPEHLERQRIHAQKTIPPEDYNRIWEGDPLLDDELTIIKMEWIEAALEIEPKPETYNTKTGYDPSGQGKDYNAVVTRSGNSCEALDEWLKSDDLREATRKAWAFAQEQNSNHFNYDSCGGFGDGVEVFVKDIVLSGGRYMSQNAFNAGVAPDKGVFKSEADASIKYMNAKAQLWAKVASMFYASYLEVKTGEKSDNSISLQNIADSPLLTKLKRELSSPLWVTSSQDSQKRKVESKEDMKKRISHGKSPNLADAFVMAYL